MEANALQEIDRTVDALRDGHAPLSDAELDFQIAKAGYENRVKNSTSVKPAKVRKLRCEACPANNRYVREYKTNSGPKKLCVKCADILRLMAMQAEREMAAAQPTPAQ